MENLQTPALESAGEKTESKQKAKGKFEAFFDRNYVMLFAAFLVFIAYMVALATFKIYPFGSEYTVASYDLSAQICPFIEHLFDVLSGKSTLGYSYAIAGGADVTGTFLYFFLSPFSLLFLICGDGHVAQAASFVLPLKLATIAFVGAWFAKRQFENIPDYLCVAVGVLYAYCGYTFVANTYINWLDFLIWLPLCVGAFRKFLKTGRFWSFSALLACCIYTCFSIACFSMFTVFPILVFYGLLCVEKSERKSFLARLSLSFLVAILAALPVLLPALAAFLRSGRGGSLFENFWYGFHVLDSGGLGTFNGETFVDKWSTSLYAKWSYIFSDSIFVCLTAVWFFRKGIKTPFSKFMLVAGVLTLLPALVDESMLLLNMGSYMSYALRFGFLNSLYFLSGACLALDGLCYKEGCAYDGAPLWLLNGEGIQNDGGRVALNEDLTQKETLVSRVKGQGKTGAVVAFSLVVAVIFAFLLWFISAGNYKTIWENVITDSEWNKGLKSFSSRFAHSLGGLEVVAVFFVLVALALLVGGLLVWRRKIGVRFVSYALLLIVGVQAVFYNNQLAIGNRSEQHKGTAAWATLSEQLEERDDSYFRIKDYNDKWTANSPFWGGNSFSVFSSVIDEDNFTIYHLFGYLGNGKNSLKSGHNKSKVNRSDEFGDSFLGYKYYFVPESKKEWMDENSSLQKYVKPVMVESESGGKEQLFAGGYYVYENEIVFPTAYRVKGEDGFAFVKPNEGNSTYRKYNQQALYEYLRGKTLEETQSLTGSNSSVYVTPESARELSEYLWARSAAETDVGAGRISVKITAEAGEHLLLNFVASKGYRVWVNGVERPLLENDLKFLSVALDEGENEVEFVYYSPYVTYALAGLCGAVLAIFAVALVLKKTSVLERCSAVISVLAIALVIALVAFFFLFPTVTWLVKLIKLLL